MHQTTENLLPLDLLGKAVKTGNELSWRLMDIPEVISACEMLNFAILGGQVKFILSDGHCELYWLNVDTIEKTQQESWSVYSQRSCKEFLQQFKGLVHNCDFENEGVQAFKYLADKKREGISICEYLYFTLYPVTEDEYIKAFIEKVM